MTTLGSYTLSALGTLREELKTLASDNNTLREAGQRCVRRLHEEFEESLVLTRFFATAPFAFLPEREKTFARRLAAGRNMLDALTEDTTVVTLLATRGLKPEWNDPVHSRHHLAIPLLDARFVETIPLIARLLADTTTGAGAPWLEKQSTLALKETVGKMSLLLYVDDARTALSSDGNRIVPAQEFVESNGIRTVLALGGSYLNGTTIALLLFTRERLSKEQSAKFTPLINSIKSATMRVVMGCKIL